MTFLVILFLSFFARLLLNFHKSTISKTINQKKLPKGSHNFLGISQLSTKLFRTNYQLFLSETQSLISVKKPWRNSCKKTLECKYYFFWVHTLMLYISNNEVKSFSTISVVQIVDVSYDRKLLLMIGKWIHINKWQISLIFCLL